MPGLAATLASHVVARREHDLSTGLAHDAGVLLRDYLGVTLRGAATRPAELVGRYQEQYASRPPESTIIASGGPKISAPGAAFTNAVAAHSLELDDVDEDSYLHFGAPVVSAALAVGEALDVDGSRLLTAITVGCEVMLAISRGANPGMRDRGFHSTAVCGVFGATAAAGCLLELDVPELVSAFGLAGAQAAGLFEVYGPSMQKSFQAGPAAHNGVVAARMARLGVIGADTALDGPAGLLNAFSGSGDPDLVRESIDDSGRLRIEYKPYACFRPLHTAIDAALEIRGLIRGRADLIVGLKIHRHPQWAAYHMNAAPATGLEARTSLNHAIAVAAVEGTAQIEQFGADRLSDPQIQRLSRLLTVAIDPELARGDSCRLEVAIAGNETIERRVDFPKGSLQAPMTEEDHRAKFRYLVRDIPHQRSLDDLLSTIDGIGKLDRVSALIDALPRPTRRRPPA